jgi:hypothetical protein
LLRKVWAFLFSPLIEVDFKYVNDLGSLGLRASSFSVNGAHLKQKSTLLRKVWAFLFSPLIEMNFKRV